MEKKHTPESRKCGCGIRLRLCGMHEGQARKKQFDKHGTLNHSKWDEDWYSQACAGIEDPAKLRAVFDAARYIESCAPEGYVPSDDDLVNIVITEKGLKDLRAAIAKCPEDKSHD